MGALEKYIARPQSSVTTFTTLGSPSTAGVARAAAVPTSYPETDTIWVAPSTARRAQSCWDDGERPHTRRPCAVPAASVTLRNVAPGQHPCKRALSGATHRP